MFTHLWVSYATWKNSTVPGGNNKYYVKNDNEYTLVKVDKTSNIVLLSSLIRIPTTSANVSDFETNLLGTSTLKTKVDECIADEEY